VRAVGLVALAEALNAVGEVVVVAPAVEQSGTSHGLTLRRPLKIEKLAERWHAVHGTPADCVNVAFFHLLDRRPDLVVSGVNNGFNLGDDILYSGTVGAALEGRILGAPSMAVSTEFDAGREVLEHAARVAARLAVRVLERGLPADSILNVNVPAAPRGFRVTRQGRRLLREGLLRRREGDTLEFEWIGLPPTEWVENPHADHTAIAEGLVSLTPLHSDLTFHRSLPDLEAWDLPAGDAR